MAVLRVVRNGQNFVFRGSGKPDGSGDEVIGSLEIPNKLFLLLRDASNGRVAIALYRDAFNGVEEAQEAADLTEDDDLKQLLQLTVAAAKQAKLQHGSTEFELSPEVTQG